MKIIADMSDHSIEDHELIQKILTHLKRITPPTTTVALEFSWAPLQTKPFDTI